MGSPKIPDPSIAAVAGIQADTELNPFQYLINAASTLGTNVNYQGQNYDFTGLGQADIAGKVSDQMAATLLALQREKSPQIIQQRLSELKAADPQGYAARQQLFDRIMADAQANPDRPVATELQTQLQNELSKGAGFDDLKQQQEVQNAIRGQQIGRGIYRGNAPTSEEAKTTVAAGESLRNQREANALALLRSGASPEDVAYRRFQQSLANLASFQQGEAPTAQFQQLSAANTMQGPGWAPNSNTFNQSAAGQGLNNALGIYQGQVGYNQSQANPWLSGLSMTGGAVGNLARINPGWFQSNPNQTGGWSGATASYAPWAGGPYGNY